MTTFGRAATGAVAGTLAVFCCSGCGLLMAFTSPPDEPPGLGDAGGTDGATADASSIDAANTLGPARWLQIFGTAAADPDLAGSLAVGSRGEIYFTAEFAGDIQIGNVTHTSSHLYRAVLTRLDSLAAPQWSRLLGKRTPDAQRDDKQLMFITSLAVDAAAQPIVGGTADGYIDFGDGMMPSAGYPDAFLARFTADGGSATWSHLFSDPNSQLGKAVAVGADGSIVLTGYFNASLKFGNCPPIVSQGVFNAFVVKFDARGECVWSRQFGSTDIALGLRVAVGRDGEFWLAGEHTAAIDFDEQHLDAAVAREHFLALLDASGQALHVAALDTDVDGTIALATDADDNVLVAGGNVSGAPALYSMLVRKYDRVGSQVWERRLAGPGASNATGIDVDARGRVLVTGQFLRQVGLDAFTLTCDDESADASDVFVAMINGGSGAGIGLTKIGGTGSQRALEIRHDPAGGVVVLGEFDGSISDGTATRSSAGGVDVFIARFGP